VTDSESDTAVRSTVGGAEVVRVVVAAGLAQTLYNRVRIRGTAALERDPTWLEEVGDGGGVAGGKTAGASPRPRATGGQWVAPEGRSDRGGHGLTAIGHVTPSLPGCARPIAR
jgi:hypothetical protein